MIKVIFQNCHISEAEFAPGTNLRQMSEVAKPQLKYQVLGALVNNKVREMNYPLFKPKTVSFFDITHPTGQQMYLRSLSFLFYKALKDLYPDSQLLIKHSISGGKYCEINKLPCELNNEVIAAIKKRMRELVELDIPFEREEMLTENAIKLYEERNLTEKKKLFQSRNLIYTSVYKLQETVNYYYGYLVPSTSYLQVFHIEKYYSGVILQPPSRQNPAKCARVQKYDKLFSVFQEHKKWVSILGAPYVGDLNLYVDNKNVGNLIKVSEALHEKKLALIADDIDQRDDVKIILVSGPSSSGKTTFSKRLSVQLQVLGYKSVQVSMDDYFVEREQTPLDEHGNYDFECPEALDIELFNTQLSDLLKGKEIDMPVFDFSQGRKTWPGKKLILENDTLVVIEGIHALNPMLTASIDSKFKYKVFVSALTQISVDTQNPIPTTDNRLIRRIIRDYRYRGYSALDTLRRWQSVRRGEEKYIFPFQEEADIMFNSALLCELGILKVYAEPILGEVPENQPEYSEAVRLLKFLSYFKRIPEKEIPPTSILREFFGGSSFVY
jgi:uridine kinase